MTLHWQETLRLPLPLQPVFFDSFERECMPIACGLGMRLLGCWRLSSIKGDPSEVVMIWEVGGWADLERLSAALKPGSAESPLRDWHNRSAAWVRERTGTLLKEMTGAPNTTREARRRLAGRLCFHETMHIEPNMEAAYLRGVDVQLGGAMGERGFQTLGVFRPLLRSGRVINLWSVDGDLEAMNAMGFAKSDGPPDPFFGAELWLEIGLALRQHWRSVWMLPVPLASQEDNT